MTGAAGATILRPRGRTGVRGSRPPPVCLGDLGWSPRAANHRNIAVSIHTVVVFIQQYYNTVILLCYRISGEYCCINTNNIAVSIYTVVAGMECRGGFNTVKPHRGGVDTAI